jgi:glycine betaine/choline ABC-type transport system substrate-binding protein
MKKLIVILLTPFLFTFSIQSDACVGRILTIGTLDSVNENLLARLVSVLIDERTGTTVNVKAFDNSEEMYEALKRDEIGIVIENTDRALLMLNIQGSGDRIKDYNVSRKAFRERLNLVWLKPFGSLPGERGGGEHYYAAVITEDVLINFPALPRVINKLKGISDDRDFGKVMESGKSDISSAVRDFLKKKKLI